MIRQSHIVVRVVKDVGKSLSNPEVNRHRNLQEGKPNVKKLCR